MRTVTRHLHVTGILIWILALPACTPGEAPAPGEPAASPRPGAATTAVDGPAPDQDRREVVAESLPYAEVSEELVYGYFAFPADMVDPLPAIIVLHDWWGLNADVRTNVERLAASGYIVLAVDLFNGKTTESVSSARKLEIESLENPSRLEQNIGQAIEFLRASSDPPRMAILGFGFGGGWALNVAMEHAETIDAAVSFYGQVSTDEEDLLELDVPFLGFFAASDRAVPIEAVREFHSLARSLSKDVEITTFEEARRGFAEPSAPNFNPGAAADAWSQTFAFLDAKFATTH